MRMVLRRWNMLVRILWFFGCDFIKLINNLCYWLSVDHDSMYGGRVFGELHSSVRAHIDESGVLTASIVLPDETYHIEVKRINIVFKFYLKACTEQIRR